MLQKFKLVGFTINKFVYQGFNILDKSYNKFFLLKLAIPD